MQVYVLFPQSPLYYVIYLRAKMIYNILVYNWSFTVINIHVPVATGRVKSSREPVKGSLHDPRLKD